MKKVFQEPEVNVQHFAVEDIVTTSSVEDDLGEGGLPVAP